MKSTRSSLLAMAALAGLAGGMDVRGIGSLRSVGLADSIGHVESSRNGGRRPGNRHIQRQARKARNVLRHRQNCKGK